MKRYSLALKLPRFFVLVLAYNTRQTCKLCSVTLVIGVGRSFMGGNFHCTARKLNMDLFLKI